MKKFKKKPVIVKSAADFFLPLSCVYGAYVVLHGHLSPGGGFQAVCLSPVPSCWYFWATAA